MIVFVALIIVTVSIKWAKRKSHDIIENRNTAWVRSNQSAYNGDLAENLVMVIACTIGILLAIFLIWPPADPKTIDGSVLETAVLLFNANIIVIFSMIVLPGLSIGSNPKVRKFIIDEIKDIVM